MGAKTRSIYLLTRFCLFKTMAVKYPQQHEFFILMALAAYF